MRVRFELAPAVRAASHSDNQPATRALAFLKVDRRITNFCHPLCVADPQSRHKRIDHIWMGTPPLDLIAANGGIDRRAL